MLETLAVVLGVSLLGAVALLVATLPPLTLLWGAAGVTAFGCLLGLPGGVVYHLVLRRELLKLGALERGWLLRPTQLHARLDDASLARIRPWFFMGGLGFLLIMAGVALLTVTLVTHFR